MQLVRTDIAGFVGLAERGPLPVDFPPDKFDGSQAVVKISSWKEFLTTFGSFQEYSYLAYAVRAFFENDGEECYVVRVAATSTTEGMAARRRSRRRSGSDCGCSPARTSSSPRRSRRCLWRG